MRVRLHRSGVAAAMARDVEVGVGGTGDVSALRHGYDLMMPGQRPSGGDLVVKGRSYTRWNSCG